MTTYSKILIFTFLLVLVFISCKNTTHNSEHQSSCYDCFELADFDSTKYPISDYFAKPYIYITKTNVTDSGCIYSARTEINLDSVAYSSIILYKKENKMFVQLKDIESDAFTFFDFNYEINKLHDIKINYCDSLTQSFNAVLDDKIIIKDNQTVFVYRIKDFFYWCHGGMDFTASMDVVFFITECKGIIGTYLEGKEDDGSVVLVAPSGDILSEYIDYSEADWRVLQ